MYLQDVSNVPFTTTLVKIKYEAASEYAKNNNYIYIIIKWLQVVVFFM